MKKWRIGKMLDVRGAETRENGGCEMDGNLKTNVMLTNTEII